MKNPVKEKVVDAIIAPGFRIFAYMIAIDNTLVSEDLLDRKFVCNLNACKGACCIEGEAGAPLEAGEVAVIESIYEKVKPYMSGEGREAIEEFGFSVKDWEGDLVTPLVDGDKQCAFVILEKGIVKCAFEKAYEEGKTDFKKPISCHLYPVRLTKYKEFEAVNYHDWDICKSACGNGKKLGVPVYVFLKEPLIRKFGQEWYEQLKLADELRKQ